MPVVESPSWDSWPGAEGTFAPNGAFVLVKIDPVASVANLEDEETTRAAAALDRHEWVLGVVVGHGGGVFLNPEATPVMSLQFEVFAQGAPKDKAIASIPIAPSPQLYDDRPPIELNKPLPWPDLYAHTNFSSSVIISRIHHGAAKIEASMTKAQYEDLLERAVADRYNWHSLPPVTVPEPVEAAVHPAASESSRVGSSEVTEDSSSDDEDSLFLQEREEIGTKLIRRRIYAEICLDPSMCPGPLGAPVQMEEPVRRIRELWDEWEERRMAELLAKRPQTTAWAQLVANARDTSDSESELDIAIPPPMDDGILPEDAIDDRIERDRLARAANRATIPPPQAGMDAPVPITIPSPPPSGSGAPVLASPTSKDEAASNVDDHAPAGEKIARNLSVSHSPERVASVADGEAHGGRTGPPPTLESGLPKGNGRADGVPEAETPSLMGAKLAGLINRVHSAAGMIARFSRRFTLAQGKPRKG